MQPARASHHWFTSRMCCCGSLKYGTWLQLSHPREETLLYWCEPEATASLNSLYSCEGRQRELRGRRRWPLLPCSSPPSFPRRRNGAPPGRPPRPGRSPSPWSSAPAPTPMSSSRQRCVRRFPPSITSYSASGRSPCMSLSRHVYILLKDG